MVLLSRSVSTQLVGYYCDHGNQLEDTIVRALELIANISYIPEMSSINALGMDEFFFWKNKTQWKRRRHDPRTTVPHPALDLQIICLFALDF